MPITRSGRRVTAASEEIGIDEVFEASTASSRSSRVGAAKDSSFTSASSTTASISSSAATTSSTTVTRAQHVVGRGAALLRELREALAHRLEARSAAPGCASCSETSATRGRDDLGDAAAHLARADDEDVLEAHAGRNGDQQRGVALAAAASRSPRGRARRRCGAGSCTIVPTIRAPDAPIGWPSATAPPFTFTFSGSAPSIFIELSDDRRERLVELHALDVVDRFPRFLSAMSPALAGVRAR